MFLIGPGGLKNGFLGGPFWEVSGRCFFILAHVFSVLHFIDGGLGWNFWVVCTCVQKRHVHVVHVRIMLHVMCQ